MGKQSVVWKQRDDSGDKPLPPDPPDCSQDTLDSRCTTKTPTSPETTTERPKTTRKARTTTNEPKTTRRPKSTPRPEPKGEPGQVDGCGHREENSKLPFYAAVYFKSWNGSYKVCGGVIVEEDIVLTSLTCLYSLNSTEVKVVVSNKHRYRAFKRKNPSGEHLVGSICPNTFFKESGHQPKLNFVAIKLRGKIKMSENIQPACYARDNKAQLHTKFSRCRLLTIKKMKKGKEWGLSSQRITLKDQYKCNSCVVESDYEFCINKTQSFRKKKSKSDRQLVALKKDKKKKNKKKTIKWRAEQHGIVVCPSDRKKLKRKIWSVYGLISFKFGNSVVATNLVAIDSYIRRTIEECPDYDDNGDDDDGGNDKDN